MVNHELSGEFPIRILIADDHFLVRERLAARLAREPGFDLVGKAFNSETALQLTMIEQPDVVLIDPIMRDGLGLATLRRLVTERPETGFVVLTAVIDASLAENLKALGVQFVLSKGISTAQLLTELRSAAI
jgi:DNA-binding NarL/FixJ family response regulator